MIIYYLGENAISYCSSAGGKRDGTLIFVLILQCFAIIKLIFTVYYFRNFEESEDELRNEVVESLEKLAVSKEEEKRGEACGSSRTLRS